MKKLSTNKQIFLLFSRYIFILILGIFVSYFSTIVFYPTIKTLGFLLNLISNTTIIDNFIFFNGKIISIISACVAGSAYYLLLILCFSVKMDSLKRAKLILFSIVSFFIFNILRIFFLSLILNWVFFDAIHLFLWYFVSTLAVLLIWFAGIKLFRIKEIPVYSDIRFILSLTKNDKKKFPKE